ncbi:MAG TPA: hypothetical protein VNG35_06905 [Gemmatimonadales bacterium]|nr:hypothetical protein [Gemmatimonadales bacterium]
MRLAPILAVLLWCAPVVAQTPAVAPAAPAPDSLSYRGFRLASPYGAFIQRARAMTASDSNPLYCNTSRRTAQLMECAVQTFDPTDSARFYVAAFVLEGKVAFLSFGDSGTSAIVDRAQNDMKTHFGRPSASRVGMWEWRAGKQVARLTWRGRGSARWIYISLRDDPLMDRISSYVPRRTH